MSLDLRPKQGVVPMGPGKIPPLPDATRSKWEAMSGVAPQSSMSWGGVGDALGGGIKNVGEWLLKNPDSILALAALYQSHKQGQRADQLTNQAIAEAGERKRMGAAAADRLGAVQRPDLSELYTDPNNAYGRRRIPTVGGR